MSFNKSEYYHDKAKKLYAKNIKLIDNASLDPHAIEIYRQMYELYENIDVNDLDDKNQVGYRLYYGNILNLLLVYCRRNNKYEEAKQYGEHAIELYNGISLSSQIIVENPDIKDEVDRYKMKVTYNLGNIYCFLGDIEKAIDCFADNEKYGHIPSIYNLAACFNYENMPFYDKALSDEYCIKAAKIDISTIQEFPSLLAHYTATSYAGGIYFERKEYDQALQMYEEAIKGVDYFGTERCALESYLNSRILAIKEIKQEEQKYSPKHKYVLSLFSDKAKMHLKDEHYLFIETSLIVKEFLDNNNYYNLDYSSAIMSILKCVESILFDLLGNNYLDYLKDRDDINYELVPRGFVTIDKNTKLKKFKQRLTMMELGGFAYAISPNPDAIGKTINPYFKEYMEHRGVLHTDEEYLDILEKLMSVKNNYRNIAVHKEMVDRYLASNCIDYLLKETIKFINYCLEMLY